jgi:hypothetical protein
MGSSQQERPPLRSACRAGEARTATANADEHRCRKEKGLMSTTQAPALDMNKLNAFIGQFVNDLDGAVFIRINIINEKLDYL